MVALTASQYSLIVGVFVLCMCAMAAAALYFLVSRSDVLPRYRTAVTLCGLFCAVAGMSYFWHYTTWRDSFTVSHGVVTQIGETFDDSHRYVDWVLTVPLQLIAFAFVLDLPTRQARVRSLILGSLGAEMVMLGYPGQISTDAQTRWLWFGLAIVPFLLIVGQLFVGLAKAVREEPEESRGLVKLARLVLLVTWPVYALVYLLPLFDIRGSTAFVGVQAAYAAADIGAKVLYAALLCMAASSKSAAKADAAGRPLSVVRGGAGTPPARAAAPAA